MPLTSDAEICITGFDNVPAFAKGMVRDIRVRWACEEIGLSYRTELFDAFTPRSDEYRARQPFDQVPAFRDSQVEMFESGAILLYLGEQDERLLPHETKTRWQAITWMIAALNSVEPMLMAIVNVDIFNRDKEWAKLARPDLVDAANRRLASLSAALGNDDWLAGPFTIADIMMVTVLRNVKHTQMLDAFPNLAAYRQRGEARPAFQAALEAQLSQMEKEQAA